VRTTTVRELRSRVQDYSEQMTSSMPSVPSASSTFALSPLTSYAMPEPIYDHKSIASDQPEVDEKTTSDFWSSFSSAISDASHTSRSRPSSPVPSTMVSPSPPTSPLPPLRQRPPPRPVKTADKIRALQNVIDEIDKHYGECN